MKTLMFLVVLLSGCAPLSDLQIYERENALIVARDQFELRQHACRNAGGAMAIKTWFAAGRARYTAMDYKLAECIRF